MLRPDVVIALQREGELEHILSPLRRDRRFVLHELPVSGAVVPRGPQERSARRRSLFRRYFEKSRVMSVALNDMPIYEKEACRPGRLLSLNDVRGLALALGTVIGRKGGGLEILTPLSNTAELAGLRLGSILLDPSTGEELQ